MQSVFTLDLSETDPFPPTSNSPGVAQTAAQPAINIHYGMEREVKFSEGNQVEGETINGQYIAATFEFYRISKSMDETHPNNSVTLDKLEMEKTQKLEEIRHLQKHKLVKEFSQAIREFQQEEARRNQAQEMRDFFDSAFSNPPVLPIPGRIQPTNKEPPPIPTRTIHQTYPGRSPPLTTPSKVPLTRKQGYLQKQKLV